VLGLPGDHAGREEIGAQIVSPITQRYGVVKAQGQRLVEAQPRVSCMKLQLTFVGPQSTARTASRPRASFGSTRQSAWLAFQYKR
jgi:hypothetical protein